MPLRLTPLGKQLEMHSVGSGMAVSLGNELPYVRLRG
jgi:hypothetical protein